eukprot:7891290-Lingulodinium_polyedra.AAC.1
MPELAKTIKRAVKEQNDAIKRQKSASAWVQQEQTAAADENEECIVEIIQHLLQDTRKIRPCLRNVKTDFFVKALEQAATESPTAFNQHY